MIAIWKVPLVSNNPRKNNGFCTNLSALLSGFYEHKLIQSEPEKEPDYYRACREKLAWESREINRN
jgi:hypothetical protein